jgi:DNA-binding transcriptional regulator YiaG
MTQRYALPMRAKARRPRVQVDWSRKITSMRERVGLTQREFAALVGVSSKTLENWERKL